MRANDSVGFGGPAGVKLLAKRAAAPKARLSARQQSTTIIYIYYEERKRGRVKASSKSLLATLRGVRHLRNQMPGERSSGHPNDRGRRVAFDAQPDPAAVKTIAASEKETRNVTAEPY